MLDIVTADDVVIATGSRADVHRCGLRHRAVHMLVYNSRGEMYVQQRAFTKDCSPGMWDTAAAGHVNSGEGYVDAAYRELREELGLADVPLDYIFDLPASPATGNEFVKVYRCSTDAVLIPDPIEIADGHWLAASALAERLQREPHAFTATFRLIYATLGD
jgi:isopentenyldiphosphate isomerase